MMEILKKFKAVVFAAIALFLYLFGYRHAKETAEKEYLKGENNALKIAKKLATTCLIMSVLTACTANINGNYCLLYEPVYADYEHDTPETIRQIDRNNIIYDEICTSS